MEQKEVSPLRYYILNTSFHGFRFIAEEDRHWTERVFWIICCTISWVATGMLIHSAWNDFQNNSISFVVETSYLEWDTNFPSIAICETDNQKNIAEVTDKVFGDPHDYNMDEIVKEQVYFRGVSFYTLQLCGPEEKSASDDCFLKNFSYFSDKVRSNCSQILKTCKWNNKEFDCCTYFHHIDTEMGRCYGINSMQSREKSRPFFKMVSNKNTGPGTLHLEIYGYANLYILGEQEVPSMTTLASEVLQILPHIQYHRYFGIKEIENQPDVKYVGIEQRKCRFIQESDLDVYRYYSHSACCVQCRKNAQIQKCGCAHYLMPNTRPDQQCNITGLDCLSINYNDLAVLKPSWANRPGLYCDCLPSCTEIELSIVRDFKKGIAEEYAIVKLSLEHLPTERFKRNVVRGKLDLVVSMGGATALFLGASILSFVEIIYYFPVRLLTDISRKRGKDRKKTKSEVESNNDYLPRID
ncbi:sodium channel protein Nach-like [Anoplophora glabripennis]|uniref:sodium channel protein Nach-like n=1 Tax=Anoplophora glabripennis TaxID=217634 RepID=UPI0008746110|nr:sodium channel protein Nach-like [Anoplophora glabripennis]